MQDGPCPTAQLVDALIDGGKRHIEIPLPPDIDRCSTGCVANLHASRAFLTKQRLQRNQVVNGLVTALELLEQARAVTEFSRVLRHDLQRGGAQSNGRGRVACVEADRLQVAEHAHRDALAARAHEMLGLQDRMLAELALDFALRVLTPGGGFVAKLFQGGAEREMLTRLRTHFAEVRHAKPPASRKESSETYVVALGFRP